MALKRINSAYSPLNAADRVTNNIAEELTDLGRYAHMCTLISPCLAAY